MELEVFRGDDVIATIQTGGKNAMFGWGLMNQHKLVVTGIKQYDALQVQIEDYVLINGIKFKINTVPELAADDQLSYEITFEGPKYTWHDKLFMHEGEAEFTYYGNALLYLQLFIANINEIDPTWTLGVVEDTVEKHIPFSNVTCHEAILLIAEAFGLEFDNEDKEISMVPKIGRDTGLSFEYGMGKGLYSLTRNYVSDKNIVTKVYGFGGSRNLPSGYRGGKRKLTFDGGFHTNNIDLYGIKEGQYTNDDIVPEREAAITAVTHGNPTSTITDSTLDFNIKDAVIEGLEPKIGFTTGDLAGEEFVITDYNPTTKVITYKGFINDNNVVLPNDTFRAQVGDKYVLFDIDLPGAYVTSGESDVDTETLAYVMENSVPRVVYGGILDPIHYRDNSLSLRPGDRVNFKDARIGLDATIRITEITMPLDFLLNGVISSEDDINVTISNFVTYTAQQRLRDEKLIVRHEVKAIDLRAAELARRNSANLLNVRDYIIDPATGKLITENIVEGSISALYLSIGAKATNFSLKNIAFNTNAGGNPNAFTASAGQLVHYDIKIEGVGFVWQMAAYTTTTLNPTDAYYLYAKVSRASLVGTWVLSTDIKAVESEVGYFNLQAGVLFPVNEGRRDYELTKGMTFIIGDQITAGVLKSLDGLNFFNLNEGTFNLGDNTSGLDYGVTATGRLTIRGGITQNAGGISAPITLFRGAYGTLVTYYTNDTTTHNGSMWLYKYPTPIFNVEPVEGPYWTIVAAKGVDGGAGATVDIEYSVDGSTSWHSTFTTGDKFMRQRVGSGSWSAAIRIVGEEGEPGADGKYTSYEFAKNTSLTTAPTTGFTDAPPAIGVDEFLWLRFGTFGPSGQIGTWSTAVRISGPQGEPGIDGEDGSSLYTWLKYADDEAGSGMSDYPAGKMYIGLAYNKPVASESTNAADYQWALITGEGVPGEDGEDGATFYTWIKYADSPTTGMDNSPTGKTYLGIAYNKTTPTESTDYADYSWSLIKGSDGTNGTNGSNGAAGNYTEFRFAKNGSTTSAPALTVTDADPSGWTITQPTLGAAEYGWITSSLKTAAGALVNNWSTPTRFTGLQGTAGSDGDTGATGAAGPYLNYRGDFDAGKTYVGSTTNIQAVKYSGNYYVTRTDAGTITTGTLPTDTSKWNTFGGQFESVATGLLLATLAYIENLGVRNFKSSDTGKRFEMTAADQNLSFYDADDKKILNIDSDSAVQNGIFEAPFEVYDENGNPTWVGTRYDNPSATVFYKYPNPDVGMSIGYGINDAGGFTAIGRKKVFTTGSMEVSNPSGSEKATITKDGIVTSGFLRADGTTSLNGDIKVQGNDTYNGVLRWPIYVGATLRTHEFVYIEGSLISVTNVS
jgi:hypothetical protein